MNDEQQFNLVLGEKIAKLIEASGLDDFELAAKVKCQAVEIGAYRRGDRVPRTLRLKSIAAVFGMSLDELTAVDESKVSQPQA